MFREWMEMIKSISSGIIPEVHVTDKLPGSFRFENGIFSKIMETLDAR